MPSNHRISNGTESDVLENENDSTVTEVKPQPRPKMAAVRTGNSAPAKPAAEVKTPEETVDPNATDATKPAAPAVLTDEQRNAFLRETFGTEDVEALKAGLVKKQTPEKTQTPEEKLAQEQAEEKVLLDLFTSRGGTLEEFVNYKTVLNADEKELSDLELRRQLTAGGVPQDQLDWYISQRYLQLSDEEIEAIEDEALREKTKNGREVFGKEIAQKGSQLKNTAKTLFDTLRQEAQSIKTLAESETKFSSTVDEVVAKIPEKFDFVWNEKDATGAETPITPITIDVLPEDREFVSTTLKTKSERQKLFHNEDGSFNADAVANLLLKNRLLERSIKAAYREGIDRNTQVFKSIFPGAASAVGIGNSPETTVTKGTGKMQKAGPVQRQR